MFENLWDTTGGRNYFLKEECLNLSRPPRFGQYGGVGW